MIKILKVRSTAETDEINLMSNIHASSSPTKKNMCWVQIIPGEKRKMGCFHITFQKWFIHSFFFYF